MTPVKHKLFNKLFQHYEQQQFSAVGTNATGLASTFAKKLAQMNTAAKDDVYGAVNTTADNIVEFQVRQSDDETAATTCSIADTDRIVSHLEEKINAITWNEQMRFNKEWSIRLIKFDVRGSPLIAVMIHVEWLARTRDRWFTMHNTFLRKQPCRSVR
jgi:hypothetical protein